MQQLQLKRRPGAPAAWGWRRGGGGLRIQIDLMYAASTHIAHAIWWLIHLGIISIAIWIPGQICDEAFRMAMTHNYHGHPFIRTRITLVVMMFALNIVAFYRVRWSCPGYALPDADPLDDEYDDVEQLLRPSDNRLGGRGSGGRHWCEKCRVELTLRIKHCRFCDKCIRGWDHHCLWIGTCVGVENHRWFLLYLGSQTICTILALDLFVVSKLDLKDPRFFAIWIITVLFLTFSLIVIGGLFCWHACCALSGCTTREILDFGRIGHKVEGEGMVVGELKGGTCSRCIWNLQSFLSGRSPIKRRRLSGSAQHKCLNAMDMACDNQFYSCF